jgi:hypothetical protein
VYTSPDLRPFGKQHRGRAFTGYCLRRLATSPGGGLRLSGKEDGHFSRNAKCNLLLDLHDARPVATFSNANPEFDPLIKLASKGQTGVPTGLGRSAFERGPESA